MFSNTFFQFSGKFLAPVKLCPFLSDKKRLKALNFLIIIINSISRGILIFIGLGPDKFFSGRIDGEYGKENEKQCSGQDQ